MQIHWVSPGEVEDAQRAEAERCLRDLAKDHDDLIDLQIVIRHSGHHQHGEREVRIACQARGREIVARRVRPDVRLALNEVLDAFEREVHRMREKRRDRSRRPPAEPACLGIVDRVNREEGYGFILTDEGDQVYFHRNAVKEGLDFDRIQEADRVALNVEPGRDGPQATTVIAPPPGEA
jgi:cold shock CspA family protein